MKKIKKLLAFVVVLALALTSVITLVACTTPHECGHKCTVDGCNKCTSDCTDPACKDKCPGHGTTPPAPHTCTSKCTVDGCGLCTNQSCNDDACKPKCPGHTPPHVCESVCPEEGCGKCTSDCNDPACADKCKGHLIKGWYVENSLAEQQADSEEYLISVKLTDAVTTATNIASATVSYPADVEHAYVAIKYSGTATLAGVGLWGTKEGAVSAKNGFSCGAPVGWNTQDTSYFGEDYSVLVLKIDGYYAAAEWDIDTVTNLGVSLTGSADDTFIIYAIEVLADANTSLAPHVCKHQCPDETCGLCLDENCHNEACAEKCPGHTYTITLVVGDGTLEGGTTVELVNGVFGEGQYLPEPTIATAHWKFDNWYTAETGGTAIVEANYETHADATIYARYIRDDGIWSGDGETFIFALEVNQGCTDHKQYWLGLGKTIELQENTVIAIYLDGKLVPHKIKSNSTCVNYTNAGKVEQTVTVTQDARFVIYFNLWSDGWQCEYTGTPQNKVTNEIPDGATAITINAANGSITVYFVHVTGQVATLDDLVNFQIHAWTGSSVNEFGAWNNNPHLYTKTGTGEEAEYTANTLTKDGNLTADTTFIIHWAGAISGKTQSGNFGNMTVGNTYVVELVLDGQGNSIVYDYVPAETPGTDVEA